MKELLRLAYQCAAEESTDPNTQNGAILVNQDGEIVAKGANCFPKGVRETQKRWKRPEKYKYVEHAERNAIYDAARNGVSTEGLTMYCPWAACPDCARAIIQSGIERIVVHKDIMDKSGDRWSGDIEIAIGMFNESGVVYESYKGEIGGVEILFDSETYSP